MQKGERGRRGKTGRGKAPRRKGGVRMGEAGEEGKGGGKRERRAGVEGGRAKEGGGREASWKAVQLWRRRLESVKRTNSSTRVTKWQSDNQGDH
eukprot:365368-Chlamydomonas_euryale.AAC.3